MPRNPGAWLTRAVAFRSLHLARSRTRRTRHERLAGQRRPELSERDNPSSSMQYEELANLLDETLRTIPADQRDVVLLRIGTEMDYASIADALRIPVGTVRSRLNRTRQRFRDALARNAPR
jgi:RNA polymerase sigma-70 factor (ECF subfamily)